MNAILKKKLLQLFSLYPNDHKGSPYCQTFKATTKSNLQVAARNNPTDQFQIYSKDLNPGDPQHIVEPSLPGEGINTQHSDPYWQILLAEKKLKPFALCIYDSMQASLLIGMQGLNIPQITNIFTVLDM